METVNVNNALSNPLDLTIAITAARIHHAVTSSMAAHVMAKSPRGVFVSLRSCKILARIGNAVILIEMPINRANEVKFTSVGANSLNRINDMQIPRRNGKKILT